MKVLAAVICGIFALLALWHVRMAFGRLAGESGAVLAAGVGVIAHGA